MKIVNKAEFEEIIKKGYTLVDFYADWCGPCKMLGPVLEGFVNDYPQINFVKVNCDNDEEVAAAYGIMSIPAVFLLKDGQIVNKFIGLKSQAFVKDFLDSAK